MGSRKQILVAAFLCLGGSATARQASAPAEWSAPKRAACSSVDAHAAKLTEASQKIWELAELALKEERSSALLATILEEEGFKVERGVAEMPTAFVASFGEGRPIVAFLAEFDALPGLSQKVAAAIDPVVPGGSGHGCGHNLFGAGSVGAGIALKEAMEANGLKGTVRVYGTPAEEQGIGKIFMVRDGLFNDVDACLSWHPADKNEVKLQPSKACRSFEITFYGRSAHASAAPWDGVSALDAVEAFEHGVNLLREHIPETARIHYVVTEGGKAPNVIPARARVWMYTRGKDWQEQEKVYQHVEGIVRGADLMAWGEEHGKKESGWRPVEVRTLSGLYHYNINRVLARLVHQNLALAGAAPYTEEEQVFARRLQKAFGAKEEGMHREVKPLDFNAAPEPGGSTDVANISWVAPTIDLNVANWPLRIPAHSWASTAASGSSAGYKAMLQAAKVLAMSGVDVLTRPDEVKEMRVELEAAAREFPYRSPVGKEDHPSLPSHMQK